MAQPVVFNQGDQSDLLGAPVFWHKPTPDPSFNWDTWIGQFFLAIRLGKHCYLNDFFEEPTEVFDDPPPEQKETVSQTLIIGPNVNKRKFGKSTNKTQNALKMGQNLTQCFFFKADQRVKSRLFFSLSTEGKRNFH